MRLLAFVECAEEKNVQSGGCFGVYKAVFSFSHDSDDAAY